jgi:HPt (histidine-containing phosphotransfer) domain-containing protein
MPLHLERIEWMPSPPLAPDDGPIDSAHLDRMTLGDASLEREVLAMFSGQAVGLIARLATLPSDVMALAHTMKGSARAIGAFRVADAAEALEAAIRDGDDPAQALTGLKDAVAEARTAIDAILRRS